VGSIWFAFRQALGWGSSHRAAQQARLVFVRRTCAAQQPDRAAPHTGVPEIGAALSGCCAEPEFGVQGLGKYRKPITNLHRFVMYGVSAELRTP